MSDLAWGLQMTALGMGLVFGLLTLLWGLLTLLQWLDRPPAEPAAAAAPAVADAAQQTDAEPDVTATDSPDAEPAPAAPAMVQGMDAELVAAILVATLAHQAQMRREAAPAVRSYWPGSLLYASRWVGAGRSRQNISWQRRGK